MDSPVINPIPVCEARSSWRVTPSDPFAVPYCFGTRGLRRIVDTNGHAHYACGARGHFENVASKVRRNAGWTTPELAEAYGS